MKVLEIRKANMKPFEIAKVENEGNESCVILIGETKITTEFKTFEEANEFINKKPYELIFAIAEAVYNFKTKQNGNN